MRTFSIVIPTYNGADFIEQALLSALNQTRKADEIIISDDNSTDETIDICQRYKDKIKIYHNSNGPSGFVNGWNIAITYATSEYISILHQDDLLAPTFLEEVEKALWIYPKARHFFVPCNYINEEGVSIQEPNYCDNLIHQYIGKEYVMAYQTIGHPHIHRCPGVVTHKDIFKVCSYRAEAGHIADDDFFYRVGQYTDVVGILKPLASYRLHQKSETGHLGNNRLIQRLANDYIFQLKHFSENKVFDKHAYQYFVYNAIHFAFNEYIIGVKYNDMDLMTQGIRNLKILKNMNIVYPIKVKLFILFSWLFGTNIIRLFIGNSKL
jgi:glycosyltransferase involved in cell wall biosynthesis